MKQKNLIIDTYPPSGDTYNPALEEWAFVLGTTGLDNGDIVVASKGRLDAHGRKKGNKGDNKMLFPIIIFSPNADHVFPIPSYQQS